jgi:hypoxanthine-DNA glycosylase
MHRLRCLPPIAGPRARVLVLGSMPGARSLELGEYYGHPQNAFWRVAEALGVPAMLPYAERCRRLASQGIALWDVLATCEREGSLDQRIRRPAPNDLARFVARRPELRAILFNGRKARELFDRHVALARDDLALRTMPSTSPAHVRPDKAVTWAAELRRWLG